MSELTRRPGAILALALAAALPIGCADIEPQADPFAGLRAEAAAPYEPDATAARQPGAIPGEGRSAPVRGFIRRGGPTLWPAATDGAAPPEGAEAGEFTLNFENADLREVVRAMLEDGLGENFAIDPDVQGTVSIRTNRPLTRAEILPTLEEILRLNDAALVDQGAVLQVIPRQVAGLGAPVIDARSAAARGLTVRVTPLRHVGVEDVRGVLEAFAPAAGAITFDARRNLVFSIGTAAEQQSIMDVVALLDVDAFAGRSFALVPLRNGSPEELVVEMGEIFREPRAAAEPAIRFLAIERMNAVLAISERADLMDEAVRIMRDLDQGGFDTEQLYVYPVENRGAAEVAQVLGDIFGVQVTGARPAAGPLGPGLTAETGFAGAGSAAGGAAGGTGAGLADAPAAGGDPGGGGAGGSTGGGGESGVRRIAADEASNTVVALATRDGARRVENALRRLDVQPLQVMLQATLAEVVLNDRLQYGVRWFFESGNFGGNFSDAATGAVGSIFPGFNAVFNTADVRIALSALDAVTDVRFLSSPTLMVLDNQTARLQVGDQVPIQTRSAQSVEDTDAPIVAEIEYRDTGVILTIRPRVNESGLITLDIRQEVSDVVVTPNVDNPTFSQRVVESAVAVSSGDTVAIAGLIRESAERDRSGIPILSRIPVAGAAFGATDVGVERTELIVLITPIVVRDQKGARAATDELRAKLGGIYGPPPIVDPLTGPRRPILGGAGSR